MKSVPRELTIQTKQAVTREYKTRCQKAGKKATSAMIDGFTRLDLLDRGSIKGSPNTGCCVQQKAITQGYCKTPGIK
jgi:hypothetical protein